VKWRSFALTFLALTLLEVLTSASTSAQNATGLLAGPVKLAGWFLSPSVPAFGLASSESSAAALGAGAAAAGAGQGTQGTTPAAPTPSLAQLGLGSAATGAASGNGTSSSGGIVNGLGSLASGALGVASDF
jgi:hypothetical protein